MKDSYTIYSLTRFLYHDVPAAQVASIAHHLHCDPDVRAEFEELRTAKRALDRNHFNPSTNVIRRILAYSSDTALQQV